MARTSGSLYQRRLGGSRQWAAPLQELSDLVLRRLFSSLLLQRRGDEDGHRKRWRRRGKGKGLTRRAPHGSHGKKKRRALQFRSARDSNPTIRRFHNKCAGSLPTFRSVSHTIPSKEQREACVGRQIVTCLVGGANSVAAPSPKRTLQTGHFRFARGRLATPSTFPAILASSSPSVSCLGVQTARRAPSSPNTLMRCDLSDIDAVTNISKLFEPAQ